MPTTRPRYQITETAAVAQAIDLAAQRWPDEPRSKLLLRLIDAGGAALEQSQNTAARQRQAAVEASSGKYPDAFGADYLAELRQDWPE
jgi:non-ribosomal peptide synthetase component E (peptide arylation enzyme)